MHIAAGLTLAVAAAIGVNWGYSQQHTAVAAMPPLHLWRPLQSLSLLLRSRRWLLSLLAQGFGWLCYLAALRLSPIALVQAVGAAGIVVLAITAARGHPNRLTRPERLAVVVGVVGLLLVSLSLINTTQADHKPAPTTVVLWIVGIGGGSLILATLRLRLARAAVLGLAAGLMFAAGDICSKLVVYGHAWIAAGLPLLGAYAAGTMLLQTAFQHGNALTTAGLSTLATNALPIASGFVLFDEKLPHAAKGSLQVAGFATLVASAILLARTPKAPNPESDTAVVLLRPR